MLATTMILFLLRQEPVLQLLPADQSRVPPHCAEWYSLEEWKKLPEGIRYIYWRQHRQYEQIDRIERKRWLDTCEFNAKMRALGQDVPPDPVEPTPFWKRLQKLEFIKDR